jgi:hypothetical protein
MTHTFHHEFYGICSEIISEQKNLDEWAEIQSDDLFQVGIYEGGFSSIEMEFTFSIFLHDDEYWFQLPLYAIPKILNKEITEVQLVKQMVA